MVQENWQIVFGNDLEILSRSVADELFSSLSLPFETRIVVVPNIKLKEFLFQHWARDSHLKIAAGVQVLPLKEAMMEILDSVSTPLSRKRIPTFLELSLAIEEKLFSLELPGLDCYLNLSEVEKKSRRIAHLSDELSKCFSIYGLYGEQFLRAWLAKEGWQQTLWNSIFTKESPWTYPIESLTKWKQSSFQGKIALFGFTYLSPVHLSFFSSLAATIYHLSPCALFWEDFASDKERLFKGRLFRKKGGKEGVLSELDQYMKQSHPLLANFGKLGREMLKSLHAFTLEEKEVYQGEEKDALLSKLKTSLLTLDESEQLHADESIQLHSATTLLREVEALRDTLETLLQDHLQKNDPIPPREILIASPNISEYAPYIHMVFSEGPFSYAIEGIPLICQSQTVQGFKELLELPNQRYALEAVLKLFACPAFMEKQQLSFDEVVQIERWCKSAQIKQRLSDGANSWEAGIDRLIFGLCVIPDNEAVFAIWPLPCIPQSEIDLFNRFLELFCQLKTDLASFAKKLSASKWLELFLQLAEKYFVIDWERQSFFQELKALCFSCKYLQGYCWNFESIWRVVDHLFQKPLSQSASSNLEKITFVPLTSGNIKVARIVWCLGMNEGDFPGKDEVSSLCEMGKDKTGDYFPSKADEDRSIFLEMIGNAKDYLIFSYQRVHLEDGKHQSPSLLIEELNQYLQGRGVSNGISKIDHPAFSLDRSYFTRDASVKKWSESDFLAAKAHYSPTLSPRRFFQFSSHSSRQETPLEIDIVQLKKLARHPLQFYFNETLKIYLREEEDEEEAEFLISHLRKAMLRKKAIHVPMEQIVAKIKAEGKLPQGLFQQISVEELEEEMQDLFKALQGFDLRAEEIHSVRLNPPLKISLSNSRVVYITGELENVTPKGILAHTDGDLKSLVKIWPLYLIYRCIYPENHSLLLTKKGDCTQVDLGDPREVLAAYLEYFFLAKQSPCPLMPEWAKSVLEGSLEDFQTVISKDSEDLYLNYLKRRSSLMQLSERLEIWNPVLRRAFAPLIQGRER